MSTQNIKTETGTYEVDKTLLDKLTHMTAIERHALINWYGRQGEAAQVEATRLQTGRLNAFIQAERSKPNADRINNNRYAEVRFAHLVLAINAMRYQEAALQRKGTPEAAAEIIEHRVARINSRNRTRRAPEREKFRIGYFHLVKQLRGKGMSWRDIEEYLRKNHRAKWKFSWLRDTYERLAIELALAGIDTKNPE